jgi:serine/threonine protein kinase
MMAEPVDGKPHTDEELNVAQVWLDALSRGACDQAAFLRAVQKLTEKSPEAGWESLSLLDQYYRRGKIKPEVFRSLKTQLGSQLLGPATDVDFSIPLPQKDESPPSPQTAGGQSVPVVTATTASVPVVNAQVLDNGRRGVGREIAVGDALRGRYVIKSILGRGGTGTVFEAIDQYRLDLPDAGQRVALKVLNRGQAELLIELRREFQYLQSLSHPNIVRAHEYDRDGDTAFFTMEYLSGLALNSVLSGRRQTRLERSTALAIVRDIGAALTHAHSRGVVHGDLNPGNIFITNDGEVRVLDFGAAHASSRGAPMSDSRKELAPTATPRYASCQLLDGEQADARDDLYAFACVVYVLLAGKHPFGEQTAVQARDQHLKPPRPPGLTRAEWQALRSGLAFDRERRPSDVGKWLEAFDLPPAAVRLPVLLALLRVSPPARRGMMVPALAVGGLVLLAAGWWVSENFDSVARTTSQVSGAMRAAFAGAGSSLAQLWRSTSNPVGQVPDARVETPLPAAPPAHDSSPAPAGRAAPPPLRQPQVPVPARNALHSRAAAPTAAAPAPAAPALPAASPSHAPNGPALRSRIELAADTVDVPFADPAARVVIRRTGNLRGDVSFSWWTESGTAKAGQDFVPVAAHEEHIEDGKSALNLFIPVVGDPNRRQPKSFYVVINEPSGGASLGSRTLTMVTIPPNE